MTTDLRWRDEAGNVHRIEQKQRSVDSGRGERWVTYWSCVCGLRSFTQTYPPMLEDTPATCLECIADVA